MRVSGLFVVRRYRDKHHVGEAGFCRSTLSWGFLMTDDQHDSDMRDFRLRGYHDIPDDDKLQEMSYIQLSEIFHSCEKDSTKFLVVEREMKRHLAKDQAEINRKNILLGVCIGGLFSIVGALIGGFLKSCPSCEQVTPSDAVQKAEKNNLDVKPPIANLAPSTPAVAQPTTGPAPVQSNAQPNQ